LISCAIKSCWRWVSRCNIRRVDIQIKGHAIEFALMPKTRLMSSVPARDGLKMYFQPGGRGVRVDYTCLRGLHDPINVRLHCWASFITTGKDRREAMDRMNRALAEYMITGIKNHRVLPASHHAGPEFPAWRLFNRFSSNNCSAARGVN